MAFLIIFVVIVFSVVGYVFAVGLRYRDIPVLLFLSTFVFFLSRFNGLVQASIGGRPYVGIMVYSVLSLGFLVWLRSTDRRPVSRILLTPLPFLVVFFVFSLLSGFANGEIKGVFSAVQVIAISLTPALLAWTIVELYPRDYDVPQSIRRVFIVTLGMITPLILIVSALMPSVFGDLLGWDAIQSESGLGFVRGWSPLGSTIATGCLIVMAYGFALNEAVVRKSLIHSFIAVLASVSILFTASRSVLVSYLIFNLVYLMFVGGKTRIWKVSFLPLLGMLAVFGYSFSRGTINFGRFLETGDFSLYIRVMSLRAAVLQFLESLFLGKGPGLLYSQIRTDWLVGHGGEGEAKLMLVGGTWSAMEPHNLYLLLLAEHGLIASLAYMLALLAVLVVVILSPALGDPVAKSEKATYIALWVSMMAMFLSASWPLINLKFSIFFWLFLFSCLHWSYGRFSTRSADSQNTISPV